MADAFLYLATAQRHDGLRRDGRRRKRSRISAVTRYRARSCDIIRPSGEPTRDHHRLHRHRGAGGAAKKRAPLHASHRPGVGALGLPRLPRVPVDAALRVERHGRSADHLRRLAHGRPRQRRRSSTRATAWRRGRAARARARRPRGAAPAGAGAARASAGEPREAREGVARPEEIEEAKAKAQTAVAAFEEAKHGARSEEIQGANARLIALQVAVDKAQLDADRAHRLIAERRDLAGRGGQRRRGAARRRRAARQRQAVARRARERRAKGGHRAGRGARAGGAGQREARGGGDARRGPEGRARERRRRRRASSIRSGS